jgi:putative tricarboxylic transport membrane protein
VVNKPGGGASWAYLNQHAGDGHYLLVTSYNIITNHITGRSNLSYRDFTPIALLFSEFIAYSVHADSVIRNVGDLLQQLRKDPAAVPVGISSSIGGANHIAFGLFMKAAGADVKKMKVVVFNSGAESVTALLGRHVDLVVASGSAIAGQFATGRLRPLAFAAPRRLGGPFATVSSKSWRRIRWVERIAELMNGVIFKDGIPAPDNPPEKQRPAA